MRKCWRNFEVFLDIYFAFLGPGHSTKIHATPNRTKIASRSQMCLYSHFFLTCHNRTRCNTGHLYIETSIHFNLEDGTKFILFYIVWRPNKILIMEERVWTLLLNMFFVYLLLLVLSFKLYLINFVFLKLFIIINFSIILAL